ncbi:hypothetical protein [Uliginosibacterium gangwonense]|uniref:hypothetical protein n=1 Tax=Uliginosibacterium gangwonense TaxID=392736 RepID=UPI00037CA530|nr:hypothetical protein [Uliginosibacterium gangwonense]
MNVSAVDQSLGPLRSRPNVQQARSDFDQLVQSLQNGNLGAAQQAYADFQRVQASFAPRQTAAPDATTAAPGVTAAASTSLRASQSPVATDWAALGQALQTGSLGQAQNALDRLEGDAQTVWQSHLQQQIQNAQSVYALMQGASQEAMALPTQAGTANGGLSTSVQTDLASLGQSIQSGDNGAAQRLLSQLEQDIKSMSLASGPATGHLRNFSATPADSTGAVAASATPTASTPSVANTITALDGPHPNNIAKVASALSAAGVQSARPIGITPPAPPTPPSSSSPVTTASAATANSGNATSGSTDTHASHKAHAHKPDKHIA